jgi:very-short-patch-repair endonuclease
MDTATLPHRSATNGSDSPDGQLAQIARKQFGTFSRRQALTCGFTRHQVTRKLANGTWTAVHPGVYRVAAAPQTRSSMATAGLLYAGEQAWFSHSTSARLHGIDPLIVADRTWLTVPAYVQRTRRPGLLIVRSRRIEGFTDIAHDQPVLDVRRTIVDLARIHDEPEYRRVLYDVFNRGLLTVDELLGAAEDFGGKTGVALVHRAVAEFDPAFESELEHEADVLLRTDGLTLERQYEIRENGILLARLDFADEQVKLGIEVDGARFHSSPTARFYDRERDRMLGRMGWRIERLTTDDVRRRPQVTLRHIRLIHKQLLDKQRKAP